MATTTFQPYTGNGSNKTFNYSFPTYTASEVVVEVDGVVVDNYTIPGYQTTGTRTVTFDNSTGTLNTDLCESDGAPKNGLEVIVRRDTNIDNAKANYTAGSSLKAADLTNNNTQILRALQEEQNTPTTTPRIRDQAITSAKIKNLTIVDEDISATAEIEVYKLKDGSARQVLQTDAAGTGVQWTSNVDLPGTLDVTGNVDFDNDLNVDGITTLDSTVVDGALVVNGSAVVDNVQVNGNEIDTTSGNLTIDSAGGTTTVDDNLAVSGTLNVTQGITLQNATASLNGSQIVTETASQTLTNKTLTTPVINDLSGTAVVTSGTSSSDNKVYSAKRAGEIFYGKGTVEEIQSGETWAAADDKVATTAAIDARIIDLVDDVGGFVPIANELSFPNANPDVNNGAGTLVSIKALSTAYTSNNSGTFTIANGTVGNSTVTVNGATANTTFASGFGMILETTTTLNTYNFHRLVPKATEVTTVAANTTQVGTVHTNITQVQTVHNNINNINAVAADATDIGTVAARDTEIGRLGTADAVADMAILGTTDVVADLNTLGTADVVADMNMLATSDVIADMNMLAVSDVISDMNDLATSGNITAMSTCSTNIASINNASANINSANNFGDQYQVASNNPSTDGGGNALAAGDLYFNTSANELKVYNGSSWQAGVTATGNFASVTGNTFTGDNRYNDGVKALYGTHSDLEIYHTGSHSYIKDVGTGDIVISSDEIRVVNAADNENLATFTENADVALYYDGSKKLETTSTGVALTGNLELGDNERVVLGDAGINDSHIRWDGNHLHLGATGSGVRMSCPGLQINNYAGTETLLTATENGSVELFHNNSKKLETISSGVQVSGTLFIPDGGPSSNRISIGSSGDLQIYHDGNSKIFDNGGGYLQLLSNGSGIYLNKSDGESMASFITDGAVELFHNGTKKIETYAYGVKTEGHVWLSRDSDKAYFGAGSDLEVYHDGSSSRIHSASHNLYLRTGGQFGVFNGNGLETFILSEQNGAVNLYYDHSKKFETTSTGGQLSGRLTVRGANDTTFDHVAVLNLTGTDAYNSGEAGSGINFIGRYNNGGSTTTFAQISGIKEDTGDGTYDGALTFGVRNDAEGVNIERVRITSTGNLRIPKDNARLQIGASQDLDLYHNGSNSYIENNTGNFVIDNQGVDMYINSGNDIYIRPQGGENGIKAIGDGGVELYYDASKKFETKSTGGQITGQLQFADGGSSSGSNMASFGSSDDLKIYHDGTHSYISNHTTGNIYNRARQEWHVRCNATDGGADDAIIARQNGSVELYYDHVEKFKTTSNGATVSGRLDTQGLFTGDNNKILVGNSDDLQIYHDGSASRLHSSSHPVYIRTGGQFGVFNGDASETYLTANLNGAVNLYYDNSIKLNTISAGCQVTGNIYVYDGNTFTAGNSNDGQFYHNGTDTYVSNSTGKLRIRNTHADEIKLDTNSTTRWNVGSTGHIYPDANNTYDIGTSSYRVRNIYTNDLHLSNKGHSNDVDGSWGDWTIQEGESDLFLKNNRSGKKYKFNLTEVL